MFKKLLLTSVLILSLIGIIFPSNKENTKLFDYCYALEKILLRNSIQSSKKLSSKVKSISQNIAKFGVSKTKGALLNKMIDQYKSSKNNIIINVVSNNSFCLAGYWIEKLRPGTFESIFYEKSKEVIIEFKDLEDELNQLFNNFNSEYKSIKDQLKEIF